MEQIKITKLSELRKAFWQTTEGMECLPKEIAQSLFNQYVTHANGDGVISNQLASIATLFTTDKPIQ